MGSGLGPRHAPTGTVTVRARSRHVPWAPPNNDSGPFGVSLEVFLPRSEARLSRFDLRRVLCFAYQQCAVQTMQAPQKEVHGVKW